MKKFLLVVMFVFALMFGAVSQSLHPILNSSFSLPGEDAPTEDFGLLYLKFDPLTPFSVREAIVKNMPGVKPGGTLSPVFGWGESLLEIDVSNTTELHELINALEQIPEIEWANPVYDFMDKPMSYSNRVLVMLKDEAQFAILQSLVEEKGGAIEKRNEFDPLLIQVTVPKSGPTDILEMTAYLQGLNLFEAVETDFLLSVELSSVNDPNYAQQWALNNTGTNVPGGTAIADSDMNVE